MNSLGRALTKNPDSIVTGSGFFSFFCLPIVDVLPTVFLLFAGDMVVSLSTISGFKTMVAALKNFCQIASVV